MTDIPDTIPEARSYRALKWLLYLFGSCLFVILGLEGLLNLTYADPDYYWDNRFLFISPNAYINREGRFWTYRPETAIREVGVYGVRALFTTQPRVFVEYDCSMTSNNLGLLQTENIERGAIATIIFGDSFTAGQGGCPWFDRLRAKRKTGRLVNAALPGAGFGLWARLLDYLQKAGIKAERILIVAISDDFSRTAWIWPNDQLDCLNQGRCSTRDVPGLRHPLEPAESHSRLIERSTARFAARYGLLSEPSWGEVFKDYLRQQFYLAKFIGIAYRKMRTRDASAQNAKSFPEADGALETFKSIGVPLRVLLVSQRDEVGPLGNRQALNAAIAVLNAHGVEHTQCRLSKSDFLPFDGHPNRAGYDHLLHCVDEALDTLK